MKSRDCSKYQAISPNLMIFILYARISNLHHEDLEKAYLEKLAIECQKKITNYHRWQDAQLSLLGRILLMTGLKELNYSNDLSKLEYTKYNKPFLRGARFKFNISHSGEMVVCALTQDIEIGIDIELMSETPIENYVSQMTNSQYKNIVNSPNPNTSFYKFWTQKEAVLKADGCGLSASIDSVEMQEKFAIVNDERFYLKEVLIDPYYKCHIAFQKDISDMSLQRKKNQPTDYKVNLMEVSIDHILNNLVG